MGDGSVTNPPPQQPPARDLGDAISNAERGAEHGLSVARPYLEAAGSLFGGPTNPRPADAYDPRRSPTEHLTDMNRAILFRPTGRAFEVGAMGDRAEPHGPGGRRPEDGVRVIRDGRMILMPGRGEGRGEDGVREAHASPEMREARAIAGAAIQRSLAGALTKEDLSQFERIFMAHFEGGIPIGDKLTPGQFKFLSKSEKAWMEFFQKFLPFMMAKTGKVSDVEMLVFRGLLKDLPPQAQGKGPGSPGSKDAKGDQAGKTPALFLVSDMKFVDGKTDKFARLQIQSQELAQSMSEKAPGDVLGKDFLAMVADQANGEEFSYLSLSHKVVNPDMVDVKNPIAEAYRTPEQMKQQAIREGTRDATQGIALNARTEQLMAEKLDINLKTQTRGDVIGADRRGGGEGQGAPGVDLGGLFLNKKKRKGSGTGAEDADNPSVLMPWLRQDARPQQFKGKPRWWVPFLYFLGASAAALALVYAVRASF